MLRRISSDRFISLWLSLALPWLLLLPWSPRRPHHAAPNLLRPLHFLVVVIGTAVVAAAALVAAPTPSCCAESPPTASFPCGCHWHCRGCCCCPGRRADPIMLRRISSDRFISLWLSLALPWLL